MDAMGTKPRFLLPNNALGTCETLDRLPPATRALVHEFGYSVVRAFDMAGVRDPKTIRVLIYAVWLGARELGNSVPHGDSPRFVKTLNSMWHQFRNAEAMLSFLRTTSMVVVSREPTPAMVEASITETGKHGILSKEQKHRVRLRAAIKAAEKHDGR
jgi:hypothetical protein